MHRLNKYIYFAQTSLSDIHLLCSLGSSKNYDPDVNRLVCCQLKGAFVPDELTCGFWTAWCWCYKSWTFVLQRRGFQFLTGRITTTVVLRASIQMADRWSLGLLRCLLRPITLIFSILVALVLFRFASFSPIILNWEILKEQTLLRAAQQFNI